MSVLVRGITMLALAGAWMLLNSAPLHAQTRTAPSIANMVRNATTVPSAPVARGAFGGALNKPFSNVFRRPTVSPYLNLFRDDGRGAVSNYQTLVRPQLEQIELMQQQTRQTRSLQRLNRQVQQLQQQAAFPISGSTQIRATGHTTQFMNLSHFYSR